MDPINLMHWLSGYIEDKKTLTENEVHRIKDMISETIIIPPLKASIPQIEKMVKSLFPDLKDEELQKIVEKKL